MHADDEAPPVGEHHPTTTHAAHGAGHPELVLAAGEVLEGQDAGPRTFPLTKDVTTIGSGEDQDVRLPGLEPHHVSIVHDERDEYRVVATGHVGGGSSAEPDERALRTGARVQVGEWWLTFRREEHADHGRPYGGREGGEFAENKTQPPRPADREEGAPAVPAGTEQVPDATPPPGRQQ